VFPLAVSPQPVEGWSELGTLEYLTQRQPRGAAVPPVGGLVKEESKSLTTLVYVMFI